MADIPFKFELGTRVRDITSGVVGMIVSRSQLLNGCLRYYVQPAMTKKDTKPNEGWWSDENDLDVVDTKAVKRYLRSTGLAPG